VEGDDDVLAISYGFGRFCDLEEVVADLGDTGKEPCLLARDLKGVLLLEPLEERGAGRGDPDGAPGVGGDEGVVAIGLQRDGLCDRDDLDDGPILARDEPCVALDPEVCAEGRDGDVPWAGRRAKRSGSRGSPL